MTRKLVVFSSFLLLFLLISALASAQCPLAQTTGQKGKVAVEINKQVRCCNVPGTSASGCSKMCVTTGMQHGCCNPGCCGFPGIARCASPGMACRVTHAGYGEQDFTKVLRMGPEGHGIMPFDLFCEDGGYLGVILDELTPQLHEYFDVPDSLGVLIKGVQKDSPAEKAGIKAGDVILSIDGKKVSDVARAQRLIRKQDPGDEVVVAVSRKGVKKEFKVKLGEAPSPFEKSMDKVKIFKRSAGDSLLTNWPDLGPDMKKELKNLREEINKLKEQIKDLKSKS
ncbi:MAG: PDZ domain-containing protein [Candidatus Eisenbacteria bacterium]|nr:PDZ domain-containing protein [Candidatus Eisenbacteria bacterium]